MKYVCQVCGYVYDEAVGDEENGILGAKPEVRKNAAQWIFQGKL